MKIVITNEKEVGPKVFNPTLFRIFCDEKEILRFRHIGPEDFMWLMDSAMKSLIANIK